MFNTLQLVSFDSKIKSVAELLLDIKEVITTIEDINTTFNDECFAQKPFDELEKQQTLLKVFNFHIVVLPVQGPELLTASLYCLIRFGHNNQTS